LLPLKFASEDGTNQGGKTRGDKSIELLLDLKKKRNTLPIVLHFLVGAIKNYTMHSHPTHKKNFKSLKQKTTRCTQQNKMLQNN
jgi:hypothetical protein